jgi:uncharacterized protein
VSTTTKKIPASVVWFGIPADDMERAKTFYANLFGWKINSAPGADYYYIDTGGANDSPDGGLKRRDQPAEPIINYVSVNSVDEFSKKVERLGGKICLAKTAVLQMGYFAVCQDTEGNSFGIWESNETAK